MIRVISLGAGVQSSTMALMFAEGELTPMPDCAIFADTGAEPRAVYEWLDWLETKLPFPVHRVMHKEGLKSNIIESIKGQRFAGAPFFTEPRDTHKIKREPCVCTEVEGRDGKPNPRCFSCGGSGVIEKRKRTSKGQLRRQCTREFKVQPITQKLRRLCGLKFRQRAPKRILVTQYIGISSDEVIRMRPSREHWIEHQWPLVDAGMHRLDCMEWMQSHGYPPPSRSACTFCPYHSDVEWRQIQQSPEDWAEAVRIDEMIRNGVRGTKEKLYLHGSLKPLTEIDFSSAEDHGQQSMFGNDCEGMCGV